MCMCASNSWLYMCGFASDPIFYTIQSAPRITNIQMENNNDRNMPHVMQSIKVFMQTSFYLQGVCYLYNMHIYLCLRNNYRFSFADGENYSPRILLSVSVMRCYVMKTLLRPLWNKLWSSW